MLNEPTPVEVDLRRLAFFGPTALALLLAALKRLREEGLSAPGSRIYPPKSPPVFRYLLRMNLIRELVGEIPEDFTRREAKGFRPCQHFLSDGDYWRVAADLTDALTGRSAMSTTSAEWRSTSVWTRCARTSSTTRIRNSAGSELKAQGWRKPSSREFEIGIVDLGVGVRASLAKNPKYTDLDDDAMAIDTALKPSVTSTPDRNAGIGLFMTSLLLAENGGQMVVRSGHGRVVRGAKTESKLCDAYLPGTVVSLRASMDNPLDITAIYRQLEQLQPPNPAQESASHADHRGDDTQAR